MMGTGLSFSKPICWYERLQFNIL